MGTHVRTKTAVTVQLADGRAEAYPPGTVLALEDLGENVRSHLEEGDEYTSALFEEADGPDEEEADPNAGLLESSTSEQGGPIQTKMGEEQDESLQGAEGAGVVHPDREGAHDPADQPEDPLPQQSSGELQKEELQGAEGADVVHEDDEAAADGDQVQETSGEEQKEELQGAEGAAETQQGASAAPRRRSKKGGQ